MAAQTAYLGYTCDGLKMVVDVRAVETAAMYAVQRSMLKPRTKIRVYVVQCLCLPAFVNGRKQHDGYFEAISAFYGDCKQRGD